MVVVYQERFAGYRDRPRAIVAWKCYMEGDPAGDHERSTLAIDSAIDCLYGSEDKSAHSNPRTGLASAGILDNNN